MTEVWKQHRFRGKPYGHSRWITSKHGRYGRVSHGVWRFVQYQWLTFHCQLTLGKASLVNWNSNGSCWDIFLSGSITAPPLHLTLCPHPKCWQHLEMKRILGRKTWTDLQKGLWKENGFPLSYSRWPEYSRGCVYYNTHSDQRAGENRTLMQAQCCHPAYWGYRYQHPSTEGVKWLHVQHIWKGYWKDKRCGGGTLFRAAAFSRYSCTGQNRGSLRETPSWPKKFN